jgi:hypothetical protein
LPFISDGELSKLLITEAKKTPGAESNARRRVTATSG